MRLFCVTVYKGIKGDQKLNSSKNTNALVDQQLIITSLYQNYILPFHNYHYILLIFKEIP